MLLFRYRITGSSSLLTYVNDIETVQRGKERSAVYPNFNRSSFSFSQTFILTSDGERSREIITLRLNGGLQRDSINDYY